MIVVYLDSSDYSLLSDPRRQTREIVETRDALISFAKDRCVRFAFSAAHISEMAPVDPKYTASAIARADFLVNLCGANALISFDQLIAAEIAHMLRRKPEPPEVLNSDGTWFPDIGDIMPEQLHFEDAIVREVDEVLSSSRGNRQMRRAARRKALKGNRPKATLKAQIAKQDPKASVAEIVAKYPMRAEDAETLGKYVLGRATRAEAEEAIRHSLRDPRWLMQWFAAHHHMLLPLIDWMRAPSRKMAAELRAIIAPVQELRRKTDDLRRHLDELRRQGVEIPLDLEQKVLGGDQWRPDVNAQLVAIAKRMAQTQNLPFDDAISAADVDRYCPGLATAVRVMYASAADTLSPQSRLPKDSDFLDLIHGLYAPYVNLFRADRYMSSHLRKYVEPHTRVVASLQELPSAIEEALAADASA